MLKINKIYAVISEDTHGNEGVCAFSYMGIMLPMVAADEARLKQFETVVNSMKKSSPQTKFKLIELVERKDLKYL